MIKEYILKSSDLNFALQQLSRVRGLICFTCIEELARGFEHVEIHKGLDNRTRCVQLFPLCAEPLGEHQSGRKGEADTVKIDYLLMTPKGAPLVRRVGYQRVLIHTDDDPDAIIGVVHSPESVSFVPLTSGELGRYLAKDHQVAIKVVSTVALFLSRLRNKFNRFTAEVVKAEAAIRQT